MKIQFLRTKLESVAGLSPVLEFADGNKAYLNIADAHCHVLGPRRVVYLFGDVFYWKGAGKPSKVSAGSSRLTEILKSSPVRRVVTELEGQYIAFLVDTAKKEVTIFCDRYARVDSFFTRKGDFVFSNTLDAIFEHVRPEYDQKMLAHFFAVYGWYTPKGFTLYSNVGKTRVGEILKLGKGAPKSELIPFAPEKIEAHGEEQLEEYYQALRFSIDSRVGSSKEKIWVSSSSGWDSSTILGMLVDMYGSKRIGMMTGSMQYSRESGLINEFELNKVRKVGAFYGLKPATVDLDFKRKASVEYWKSISAWFRSRQMYSFPAFNFARISDGIAQADEPGRIVFNGETSDSFHNFGFSQFGTFFHTVKSFTEFGDKMNCYLYGPTFLKKVLNGSYPKDKVYQIFRRMTSAEFDEKWSGREDMMRSYFLPLFYGGPRVPFARTLTNPLLTGRGRRSVAGVMGEALPGIWSSIDETNVYAWIIHAYHSMHSQGSTVNVHKHAMELNNHRWRSPFNDLQLVSLLSRAPESWGRGLDFNNTKYPLKWVAQNKIKFPYELLQTGPHSYLYDVIEGFSLFAEILYRSGFTAYFKETLAGRSYRELLGGEYLDIRYLDRVVTDYLNGKEVRGADFVNLSSIVTLAMTGWYE